MLEYLPEQTRYHLNVLVLMLNRYDYGNVLMEFSGWPI